MDKHAINRSNVARDLNRASIEGIKTHLENIGDQVAATEKLIYRSATNEEKYSNKQLPYGSDSDLREVFELMRSLNYKGITDASVGLQSGAGHCLADVFSMTCDVIAGKFRGQTIDYVELGPEPVKTELLLSALKARGVDIASYTSIDINPSSAKPMREIVSRVCSRININHLAKNFNDLTAMTLGKTHPVLFTSLGFQEGNHTPSQTYAMLKRIMHPGDLFLTEMQLYSATNTIPIEEFYQLDEMKRFSRNCLRRTFGNIESNYQATIVDVNIDGSVYKTAICHEKFLDDGGKMVCFVTNYCLKYTKNELRRLRESGKEFTVISEVTTGDESLVLQLCQRVA